MNEISTRERAGPNDGLETLKSGEPMFVLQGGDPFAPDTILFWAELARTAGRKAANPDDMRRLLDKASSAEVAAWEIADYQKGEDHTAPAASSYSGIVPGEKREEVASLAAIADRVYNAVADITTAIEGLKRLQLHPEAEVALREVLEPINWAVRTIEPRRHLQRRKG